MKLELERKMNILEAREKRVEHIKLLIKTNYVVLSLRANYPGDYKDQQITRYIVNEIDHEIKTQFTIISQNRLNCGEGLVYIYQMESSDPITIKKQTIELEATHPLGRLVDLDVYYKSEQSVSRKEMNEKPRLCYLCEQDAFHCIRTRNHTVKELTSYIHRVVEQYEQRGFLS